ncbi:Hypothetical protein Minf_0574 [Methylacidiphilum infernorum V4]|uniref:Uncharacterized protein n=2 Tax=Candidatus Methylacidiphilum infernorum TaxID=511746 RepID=B3DZX1_METI4|nr:Hypothetical protein Minf_0574 [Methylacidiphilum infernorum V4]
MGIDNLFFGHLKVLFPMVFQSCRFFFPCQEKKREKEWVSKRNSWGFLELVQSRQPRRMKKTLRTMLFWLAVASLFNFLNSFVIGQTIGENVYQFLISHYESLDVTPIRPQAGDKGLKHDLLIKDKEGTFYLFSEQNNRFSLKAVLKDYAFLAAHKVFRELTDIPSREDYAKKASRFLGVDENIFVLDDRVE